MANASSQRHKSKLKTLIKKINNEISEMELTTGEYFGKRRPSKSNPDPNLTKEQNEKRAPKNQFGAFNMFSDTKILLRRGIRKLKGKPSESQLGKKRKKLQDYLKQMEEFNPNK